MKAKEIYVQSREKITAVKGKRLFLGDLVDILAEEDIKEQLKSLEIVELTDDRPAVLVSALEIIQRIKDQMPEANVSYIGDNYIVIRVNTGCDKKENKYFVLAKVLTVWLIIFIGAGMAIMNFHTDVNMGQAHQQIYTLITGKVSRQPLVMQIPYSLGVGTGISIFFNHFSRRKANIEPSPLNVEMMSYEKGIYDYIIEKQKERNLV